MSKIFVDLNYSKIYCTDIDPNYKNQLNRSFDNNIKFKHINALNINFPDSSFDVVCCKSLLGGIAKNDKNKMKLVTKEIHRVLKSNGSFIFAENIEGSIMHKIIRNKFQSSGWYYPKLNDFINILDDFVSIKYRTTGFFTILTRNEKIKSKIFLLDNLIKNIIPGKSKYLIYGIAIK